MVKNRVNCITDMNKPVMRAPELIPYVPIYIEEEKMMSVQSKIDALQTARGEISSTKAYERLAKLFDDGVFTEIDSFARSSSGYAEVVAGRGNIGGIGVFAYAQNPDVSGGAMSKAQAAKIRKVYDLALKTGEPVVSIFDSIGGRIDQGSDLLGAYGDVLRYSSNLSGVVPQISLVLGSCCGTQALIAVSGDIVVMSEKAGLTLNTDGSDSDAKTNASHGIAHLVAEDDDKAIAKVRKLVSMLPSNNLDYAGTVEFDDAESSSDDVVKTVIDGDSGIELQSEFGKSIRTVLATVEGATVGVVATNDKVLDGKGTAKAARFIRLCDAFGIPVVTLLDAEKFACIKSAAKLSGAYAEATTAKITVITGDAFGAVYIAAAGTGAAADVTYAWAGASISALSPEAAAIVELGDDFGGKLRGAADPKAERANVVAQFKEENLGADRAAADGYVQDIILPEETRAKVVAALDMLADKRVSTLPKKHNNTYI